MAKELLVTIDSTGPLPGCLSVRGRPAAADLDRFAAYMATLAAGEIGERPYARVILAGDGERLEQHGFGFATAARDAGVPHIRLDTSARRLTEPAQARAVVMAGVNEFSVGLHGPSAAVHDRLVARPGDFEAVEQALATLARQPAAVLVDIVVTRAGLERLDQTVARAIDAGAARIALWGHCPPSSTHNHRSNDNNDRAEIVDNGALIPALAAAVEQCRQASVEVALRRVPACLLGVHAPLLDNAVPDAFDGLRPGRPLAQFNCLHEATCELSEACGGLSHAYINAHGWELDRLQPPPRTREWTARDRSVETRTGGQTGPRGHAPWLALLGEHASAVESVGLTRAEARYPMQMDDGTRFVLIVTRRDSTVRYFRQSASFNLSYTDVEGPAPERAIARHVEPVLAVITANDDGSLTLS